MDSEPDTDEAKKIPFDLRTLKKCSIQQIQNGKTERLNGNKIKSCLKRTVLARLYGRIERQNRQKWLKIKRRL